jgi:hypothetical protein
LNNFVTGLVRRSAGLPLPSAVRPALRVADIPAAPGPFESPAVEAAINPTIDRDVPSIFPEPAPARASVASSPSPITSENQRVPQERPMGTEESLPPRPRAEPLRQSTPGEGPAGAPSRPPEQSQLVTRQITQQPRWQEPAAKVRTAIEPRVSPAPVSKPASPQFPEPAKELTPGSADLSPKPEPPGGAAESSAAVSASSGGGSAPEARNINVRIGKVEIRSNQPANVIQAPRPARNSGFDDLRLARTYLDRSGR